MAKAAKRSSRDECSLKFIKLALDDTWASYKLDKKKARSHRMTHIGWLADEQAKDKNIRWESALRSLVSQEVSRSTGQQV